MIIWHWMKIVHIWSFSGPYFSAFRLNTERKISLQRHILGFYSCPYFPAFGLNKEQKNCEYRHVLRSFFGPYFPVFGLNTERKNSEYGHTVRSVINYKFNYNSRINLLIQWIKYCDKSPGSIVFISYIVLSEKDHLWNFCSLYKWQFYVLI